MASRLETVAFDEKRVRALLPIIRSLSLDPEADDLPGRLKQLCASCGISLVFVPHLPKTYVNGATEWLTSDRVVIQLSLRRRYADIVWFNLFHELGHVLLHGKRNVYVAEINDTGHGERDRFEQEADAFASERLIPAAAYQRYLAGHRITRLSIKEFARTIGVHPCMVVGRLQHDERLPFSAMNDLRPKLSWEPDRLGA